MIDLNRYVGRKVMLQLKQPYRLQMARAEGTVPVPFNVVVGEKGVRLAEPTDQGPNVQPLTVDVVVGDIIERNGALLVQFKDQVSDAKMEVEIAPDYIMTVTAVCEDRILLARS
jgi:hypothetical protein